MQIMIYELRRYELERRNKSHFYERFEKQFLSIAKKYGLKIVGAWDAENSTETVYILAWPNLETLQSTWQKVLTDEEWIQIKKDSKEKYGDLVLKTHSEVLNPTSYSSLQ